MLHAARFQARQQDPVLPLLLATPLTPAGHGNGSTGSRWRAWSLAARSIASLMFDETPCTRIRICMSICGFLIIHIKAKAKVPHTAERLHLVVTKTFGSLRSAVCDTLTFA